MLLILPTLVGFKEIDIMHVSLFSTTFAFQSVKALVLEPAFWIILDLNSIKLKV